MVKKIMEGDRHAAAALIRSTEKLVAQIVFKMVGNHPDRRDLAQDIYLKTFRYLSRFRFQCKLSTWVAQISYTTCLDHLEKYRPELTAIPTDAELLSEFSRETPDASHAISVRERSEILERLSAALPPVYRTLITLFHKEELSIEEITAITGLPAGTVKNYLFRARKMLKELLLNQYSREDL